jgi:hypothetical protein
MSISECVGQRGVSGFPLLTSVTQWLEFNCSLLVCWGYDCDYANLGDLKRAKSCWKQREETAKSRGLNHQYAVYSSY